MRVISEKTENMKSVFGLEDKVRQEMSGRSGSKKKMMSLSRNIFDGEKEEANKEIMDKMKDKKLPENVRAEIEKEMKRQGG